jgi:integrase/recombinase XerD
VKKTPTCPKEWPAQTRELYGDFVGKIGQRVASTSAESYLRLLSNFFRHQQRQGLTFRDFPPTFLQPYLKSLAPHTSLHTVSALKAWLRFLFARKELLFPIHEDLVCPFPTPQYRRVILSHGQILQLLRLPDLDEPGGLRDRAILEMAYGTGMRRGELAALDLCDLDLAQGLVTIRQAKNSYQRIVPLTTSARHFLRRYLEEARPQLTSPLSLNALWLNDLNGRRIFPDHWRSRFRRIHKTKTVLGFTFAPHQIRHACATHLLTAGADLLMVKELLGHRALSSTQTYTQITPDHLRLVHERCHPRNNGSMIFPDD